MAQRNLKAEIIAAAEADAGFRAALLRDPRAAISGRFGMTLPPALRVNVVEDSLEEVTIALPLCRGNDQLPAGMLDAVAGGTIRCINDSLVGAMSGANG
ncbi:MAG TPA: NHLP leader peptide family RiPP precursor [bacterium]|nr:NHLP leader peptide family RiPP precursor [bacterium]